MSIYPWPKQPRYPIPCEVAWRCPETGERKEGRANGVCWTDSSIAAWAVDWLPRWLWWVGTNKVGCVTYEITGYDGHEYDIHEPDILRASV